MRIRLAREGFWIERRPGVAAFHTWNVLLPFLLTPVLLALFLLLAVGRHTPLGRYLHQFPVQVWGQYVWPLIEREQRVALENLTAVEPVRRDSALPSLELSVSDGTLDEMATAMREGDPKLDREPGGTRPYFHAWFSDENMRVKRVKIAYRGLSAYHHYRHKPSLRVRIRKKDVNGGWRYLELQRPEDPLALRNWLPDRLAGSLGLMTAKSDHVRLFINRKYMGVYLRMHRPGEPLALKQGRMPGAFFKGDASADTGPKSLWDNIDNWNVFGEDTPVHRAVLQRLLDVLKQPPSAETLTAFWQLMDGEVYARWAALMAATGGVHTDAWHNHMYFLSTNQGKLEAMPWDVNGYGTQADAGTPPDVWQHPISEMASRDPRWVHRRNEHLWALLNGPAAPDRLRETIDREVDRMLPDLKADANLSAFESGPLGPQLVPYSVRDLEPVREQFKTYVTERAAMLHKYFENAQVWVAPEPNRPGWARVTVGGTVAVEARLADGGELEGDDRRAAHPRGERLLLYPGQSEDKNVYFSHVGEATLPIPYMAPVPLSYVVRADPTALRFRNAITGEPVVALQELGPGGKHRSVHPWDFPPPPTGAVTLGPGDVLLTEDVHAGAQQTLTIAAGTHLRLAPGVGIYSEGRTIVAGTRDAPVVIEPAGDEPWACFGVSGAATAGSRFTYLQVRGGSVGTNGWVQFKGMLSVYDSPDVVLRHCQVGRNEIGDDAVNLGESRILVEDCVFNDARSDALDLDMCQGTVRNSIFTNAGNDGLDLMTCQVTVEACVFEGAGDKGISAGEASRAVVRAGRIVRCTIGIEAKDGSEVAAFNTTFDGNGVAWHAYQKKWAYRDAGAGALIDCDLRNSARADLSLEKRSALELVRTQYTTIDRGEDKLTVSQEPAPRWRELTETVRGYS